MYKKVISIIAALAMVLSMAACSGNAESETGTDPSSKPTQTTTPSTTEEPKEDTMVTFQETIIIDNDEITFKVTNVDPKGLLGYTVKIYAENKTDKNLMFSIRDVSVNGFMCDPLWASTIGAGMKANDEITFLASDFARNGIEEVTRIDFTLDVYNSDDWTEEHLVENTFTVYPMGEEAVEPFVRIPVEGETVLVDDENCTIIVTGFDPDSTFGFEMQVYLENKTDKCLMFSASNVAVNGFMCDPYWAVTVAPGMRSNSSMTWFDSTLQENGITEVTEITLPIRVYDNDNWTAEEILSETFTVNP